MVRHALAEDLDDSCFVSPRGGGESARQIFSSPMENEFG